MPRSNSRSSNPPLLVPFISRPLATQPCCWRCASWSLCRKFEYRLACGMCFGQPPKPIWESWPYTCTRTPCHNVSLCVCVCVLFIGGGNSCNHHHHHHLELNNNNSCSAVRQLRRRYLHYALHPPRPQANSLPPQHPQLACCAPRCAICSNLKRCLWSRSVCELPLCVCY